MSSGLADASDSLYPKALIPLSSVTLNLLAHDEFEFEKNPKWSKGPNNRALGPKYHNINCIWALKPYHLCSCTHRTRLRRLHVKVGSPRPLGLFPYASTFPLMMTTPRQHPPTPPPPPQFSVLGGVGGGVVITARLLGVAIANLKGR